MSFWAVEFCVVMCAVLCSAELHMCLSNSVRNICALLCVLCLMHMCVLRELEA